MQIPVHSPDCIRGLQMDELTQSCYTQHAGRGFEEHTLQMFNKTCMQLEAKFCILYLFQKQERPKNVINTVTSLYKSLRSITAAKYKDMMGLLPYTWYDQFPNWPQHDSTVASMHFYICT